MAFSPRVLTVLTLVVVATICVSIGETLLSVGMKQVEAAGRPGFGIVGAAMTNRLVIGGTLLMMAFFGLYAKALGLAEISFVLPITALSYLFVALMARFILHENVTPTRWAGTLLIFLGVAVVAFGERSSSSERSRQSAPGEMAVATFGDRSRRP
jgi:drug/metabolite transporter (DMT)-like permease